MSSFHFLWFFLFLHDICLLLSLQFVHSSLGFYCFLLIWFHSTEIASIFHSSCLFNLCVFSPNAQKSHFYEIRFGELFPLQLLSFTLSCESHVKWLVCNCLILGDPQHPPWSRLVLQTLPFPGVVFCFPLNYLPNPHFSASRAAMNYTQNTAPFLYFLKNSLRKVSW